MFWRGVIGYLPANVVQGVVGLLTIITFTRLLSPSQFGAYALGFSVMSLIHTCLFTWNEAAMARFWAGAAEKGQAPSQLATIYRLWLFLLPALAVAAAVAVVWPITGDIRLAALAGLAAVLPKTLTKLAQERRRAAGEVRGSALLDIAQTLGGFLVGAGLAWAGAGGAAPLMGAGVAAAVCAAVVAGGEFGLAKGGRFEPVRARSYAAYGLPVSASLILALVLATTDRFLLAAFLDEAAVGVYHAGYSLANRTLDVAFIWLGAAGGPALIMALERGGASAMRDAARQQAAVMLLLTLPAAAGLALVAQPLAEILVGPALREGAATVTPWIAASAFLSGLTTYYFSQAFTLSRRTGRLLTAMAIPATANIVLNLLLIPKFGLQGALAATVASYALGLVMSVALARGPLALPIPWRTLAQAGSATLAMVIVVSRLPAHGGLAELALKASVGGAVYGALVVALDAGGLRSWGVQVMRARRTRLAA